MSIHIFSALRRFKRGNHRHFIPILMYHSISEELEFGHPYYWINTSPKRFYEQMKFLKDNGYKVISLSEALNIIKNNDPTNSINISNSLTPNNSSNSIDANNQNIPSFHHSIIPSFQYSNIQIFHHSTIPPNKYVVLTFDDGYQDFLTEALPVLQDFGYAATLFITTGFIGKKVRSKFKGKTCLTWDEVRDIRALGVEIGSHTINHSMLYGLTWSEVENELSDSKKMIEDEIGTLVYNFSFPFAYPADKKWEAMFHNILNNYGYISCSTTKIGLNCLGDNPFSLKRVPINECDDLRFFETKLFGAYDWIGNLQTISKQIKKLLLQT